MIQYASIYEYLDAAFEANTNPTKEQISLAKKEYYKLWHKEYNRKRRKKRKEFTLGFDAKTLTKIKEHKGERSISKYLYTTIFNALDGGYTLDFDNKHLVSIHQKLMQLIGLVEELLEQNESPQTEKLLERIELLELEFSKLTS